MPDHDKLRLLTDLYSYVLNNTESFEEQNIGADLAYLMGAILKGENCTWPKDRLIIAIIEQCSAKQYLCGAYAMQHIHIEEG